MAAIIFVSQTTVFAASATVTTQAVTNVTANSATGNGTIVVEGKLKIDQYGVCWNTTGTPTTDDSKTKERKTSKSVIFTSHITRLLPNTRYFVRAYAVGKKIDTAYGKEVSFRTDPISPIVLTQSIRQIRTNSATVNGTIDTLGTPHPSQHGVCWNTAGNPTVADSKTQEGEATEIGEFTSRITGLSPFTTYYVKAYATNTVGTSYGRVIDFRTNPLEPVIITRAVTDITTTTAVGNGNITTLGIPKPTAHGFCWNSTGNPKVSDNSTNEGKVTTTGAFTSNITGLAPYTTYYVKAYAANTIGIAYGNQVEFTTIDALALTVTTQAVAGIHSTTATGNGHITDLGVTIPTAHGFCWGIKSNPTVDGSHIDLGAVSATGAFTGDITDLTFGTTYYIRAYATNEAGTVYGEERTFTTSNAASAPRATVSNTPAKRTKQTSYRLQIAGMGVVSYKYRLDQGAWSEELPVNERIVFEVFSEDVHTLQVLGKGSTGAWQAFEEATVISWTIDTTPPEAILWNYPAGTVGSMTVGIRVGGVDVLAYRYRVDKGKWSTISTISMPIQLPELQDGHHALEVVGADPTNNWQAEESATVIVWNVDARIPTAVLQNLPERVTQEISIAVGVKPSAGGIPIESYAYTLDYSNTWWYGNIEKPIEIGKLIQGEHSICVNALGNGMWQDDSDDGTSSTESATCYRWRVDLTPANPVVLAAENAHQNFFGQGRPGASKAVKLSWSWTSDDDEEAIRRYRVWYSGSEITENNLNDAVEIFCDIDPGPEGSEETFVIGGMVHGEQYFFAVKSIDMAGNVSDLNIVATVTTDSSVPEIEDIVFKQGGLTTDNAASAELMISGRNYLNAAGSNLVRFENDETGFEFSSEPGSNEQITAYISLGTPTGTYRVRVLNKNGISSLGPEMITLTDAETPLPAVRFVSPQIASIDMQTLLTITGDHFSETLAGANLVAPDGMQTPLSEFTWIDADTITAVIELPDDFPEGRYNIQVVNTEDEYNQFSAAKIELYYPINLTASSGAINTTKIVRLEDGLVPVRTTLATDDNVLTSMGNKSKVSMKIFLEPGLIFEEVTNDRDLPTPYTGAILPPRQVSPENIVLDALGMDAVQFRFGSDSLLRIKSGATMFVTLEAVFPSSVAHPLVYYFEPDGILTLAGVNGKWREIGIAQGGTILSKRLNAPEEGLTTFTVGLLLDHMSEYAIGLKLDEGIQYSDDRYGACTIGSTITDNTAPLQYFILLLSILVAVLFLIMRRASR